MAAVYDLAVYDVAVYDDVPPTGDPFVELLINGTWVNITPYVRVDAGIQIRRGRSDWQSQPQPASCRLTLDNADGRFAPRNASGAYYPYLKRNTQLRVSTYLDDGSTTVRFWGEVPSWPLSIDATGQQSLVPIEAAGPRRRLTVGSVPLYSPMRIGVSGLSNVIQYWPMEDGDAATSFANAASNGLPMLQSGAAFAADDTFAASQSLPTFGDGTSMAGPVPSYTVSVNGTSVKCLAKITGAGGGFTWRINTTGDCYYTFDYTPATAQWVVAAYNNVTNAAVYGPSAAFAGGTLAAGARVMLDLKTSGADVIWGLVVLVPGTALATTTHDTVVGVALGRISRVNGYADTAGGATATVGHVTVENGNTNIFDLGLVLTAYAGETAGDRWVRLGTALSIPMTVVGGLGTSLLGPQGELTPLQILDEAATADGALSTELVNAFGLKFRARSDMYQTATLIPLVFGLTRINAVAPIDDDQLLVNDMTVSRPGGSSARSIASTGLTPAAVGTYADSVEINVYTDDQLADQAAWRMTLGSVDAPRWSIGFDAIMATSATRTLLAAMREGDCVGLTSLPTAYGGTGADVMQVLGWTETITVSSWDFEINAGTGDPWNKIFILDDATRGVLDTDRLAL